MVCCCGQVGLQNEKVLCVFVSDDGILPIDPCGSILNTHTHTPRYFHSHFLQTQLFTEAQPPLTTNVTHLRCSITKCQVVAGLS